LQGYRVFAGDRVVGEGLKALAGLEAEVGELDVTSPESINQFRAKLNDEPVDLLLNIAGKHHFQLASSKR
jgi:short-subunit dehydrogenase